MNSKGKVFIVDDDPIVRDSLLKWFDSEGYHTNAASSARDALTGLDIGRWDVALVDIKMPGMDGIELQEKLKDIDPALPVVIMTGYASVDTAVRAMKNGAYDYITKPFDPEDLERLVSRAIEHHRRSAEATALRQELEELRPAQNMIGESAAMRKVKEQIATVAPADATVLITGESGTGKELVARAIHEASPRRHMPLVALHCAALTESLLETELFGHERGAFTGAQFRKKGKFEVADGGTVFLDEISDISLKTQTDLLRVLQEKEVVRVGGTQPIKVDFRCISATNRRLEKLIEDGSFRPDLYYRLHVFTIDVPALRERREDVPLLAQHFLTRYATAMNRATPRLSAAATDLLLSYHWPGNVRELENAIERALLISRQPEIQPQDFPFQLHPVNGDPGELSLDAIEKRHIERILRETKWNISRSARILGIDRTTLYNKIRKYQLQ